jgi:hypothetical protein
MLFWPFAAVAPVAAMICNSWNHMGEMIWLPTQNISPLLKRNYVYIVGIVSPGVFLERDSTKIKKWAGMPASVMAVGSVCPFALRRQFSCNCEVRLEFPPNSGIDDYGMVGDTGFEPVTSTVGAQKEGKAKNKRGDLCWELIYWIIRFSINQICRELISRHPLISLNLCPFLDRKCLKADRRFFSKISFLGKNQAAGLRAEMACFLHVL